MYTGENKTAITSQNMIADALLDLMQKKDFSEITIREISDHAKISRQTFYSLFGSKENVIFFILATHHPLTIDTYLASREVVTLQDFCHCFALYVAENDDFLRLLARHGQARLLAEFSQQRFQVDQRNSLRKNYPDAWEYITRFLSDGMASIASRYVTENSTVDIDDLEKLTFLLLSGKYFS